MSYNKSYHGYFEGYTEREERDERTGKRRIRRVYAGEYYRHDMPDAAWKRLKLRYVLRTATALAAVAVQGVLSFGGAASVWYIGGTVGLATLASLWLLYALGCYLLADREMKISEYRGRELLKTTAMAGVIAFGILGVGQAALALLHPEAAVAALICLAADVLVCVMLRRLYNEEKAMVYRRVENTAQVPGDSWDIRFRKK